MSIIGIISLISVFALQGVRSSSRDNQRKNDLAYIRAQIELYKSDCDKYPTTLPAVGSSLKGDGSSASCAVANTYIASRPKDPTTGRDYYYSGATATYVLCAALETAPNPADTCPGVCGTGITCNYKTINP